ncbi:hypothetical protein L249_4395 [Ophiocordyceps polyrhachis-furcata BCC 54312]|uniref:EF-hand domain-containing protein n=1 Tax=Ophiocordyceps polyrhachis-furcata BCC 54312 TaxID=1330021 RepID=A0A367L7J6_9HYPO|nr:hypothetical protein L249_4395 [Ophiocordyceps polyrhachis-furcata BCC 54312]
MRAPRESVNGGEGANSPDPELRLPLWPNLAGLELAPTTANAGEAKKFRAVACVAMLVDIKTRVTYLEECFRTCSLVAVVNYGESRGSVYQRLAAPSNACYRVITELSHHVRVRVGAAPNWLVHLLTHLCLCRRATFSAAGYAAARPSYPASLYRTVLAYHDGPRDLAIDLGCGHGVVAREISRHFKRVIGIDMSVGMVEQATETTTEQANVTFRRGGAESLSFLDDGSVDMAVAGQSAHWFDYDRAWPELSRVVRPGGSLAFWGYKDNVLVGHGAASRALDRFCYGPGEVAPGIEGMRRFWEQPGRERVRGLLRMVEPPAEAWTDVKRMEHDVDVDADSHGASTTWLRMRMRLGELEAYVRTFSAFQGWRDAHPQARSRAEGGEGDVADAMMESIVEAEPEWRALGEEWRDAETEVAWGTHIRKADDDNGDRQRTNCHDPKGPLSVPASTNYKEAFALFDKRGNGRVSVDALGDLLRACGQNPTLAEIQELEKTAGADFDFESFQRILNRPGGFRDPGEPEEYCRGFQVFDKDMTGFIGVGQLKYILTNLGEKMSEDEVDELLKAVDTTSGQVNYTELVRTILAN